VFKAAYSPEALHNFSNAIEKAVGKGLPKPNEGETYPQYERRVVPELQLLSAIKEERTSPIAYQHLKKSGIRLGGYTNEDNVVKADEVGLTQRMDSLYLRIYKAAQNLKYERLCIEFIYLLDGLKYLDAEGNARASSENCTQVCRKAMESAVRYKLQDFHFDTEKREYYKLMADGGKEYVTLHPLQLFKERYLETLQAMSPGTRREAIFWKVKGELEWEQEDIGKIHGLNPIEMQIAACYVAVARHAMRITMHLGILYASALSEEETVGFKVPESIAPYVRNSRTAMFAPMRYEVRHNMAAEIDRVKRELENAMQKLSEITNIGQKSGMAKNIINSKIKRAAEWLISYLDFEKSWMGRLLDKITFGLIFVEAAAASVGMTSWSTVAGVSLLADPFRGDPWTVFANVVIALFLSRLPKYLTNFYFERDMKRHIT